MMGLGSTIGAGLFLGTGVGISAAGPSVIVAYAIAGLLAILVMQMLGEMGAVIPATGSFSVYAEHGIGRWAGFTQGWIYWLATVAVLGTEITGSASIVAHWFDIEPWIPAAVFVVIFGGINLLGVRKFGELEYWFASIKVAVIVLFLFVGALLIFGLWPGHAAVGTSIVASGGFFPNGLGGVATALLSVAFTFGGIEVAAIAAAESEHPQRSLVSAVRSAFLRIAVFYLGSILVIIFLVPWSSLGAAETAADSPFTRVMERADLPYTTGFMEAVIVIALLSAFNAQIYVTSRMMHSLAERKEAPRVFAHADGRGVPVPAIVLSTALSAAMALLNYLDTGWVLSFLLNSAGASLLIVWGFIAVSELRLRPELEKRRMPITMWAYPYLTWFVLAALAAFALLMLTEPASRTQLFSALIMFAVLTVAGAINARARGIDPRSTLPLP